MSVMPMAMRGALLVLAVVSLCNVRHPFQLALRAARSPRPRIWIAVRMSMHVLLIVSQAATFVALALTGARVFAMLICLLFGTWSLLMLVTPCGIEKINRTRWLFIARQCLFVAIAAAAARGVYVYFT